MKRKVVGALALALLTGCSMGAGSTGPSRTSSSPSAGQGPSLAVTHDAVRQIQSNLQSRGLYDGPIDGILGPQTRAALVKYQEAQGRRSTAVLDPQTLHDLTGAAPPPASGSSTPTPAPASKH
jgi:peptidoglycan hydrolase-like protein with peptidoglycan-binding domain